MACEARLQLDSRVDSAAHHLEMRLKEKNSGDLGI